MTIQLPSTINAATLDRILAILRRQNVPFKIAEEVESTTFIESWKETSTNIYDISEHIKSHIDTADKFPEQVRLSFELYAARMAFLNVWNPESLPETSLLRRIKLIASKMEADAGQFDIRFENQAELEHFFKEQL